MASFDTHLNLASGTIVTAPTPALSGTAFTLTAGDGAKFAANMPVTLVPAASNPTAANSEIGYITAVSGDVLTITRAQEGTSAKPVQAGWVVMGTITAKTLTDIEGALDGKADAMHDHDESYVALDDPRLTDAREPLAHSHEPIDISGLSTLLLQKADTVDLDYNVAELTSAIEAKADASHTHPDLHTHANKTLLDSYDQSNANLADAVAKKHLHANLSTLDATTAPFTTAKDTKLSGIATGATQNATDASLRDRSTHTGTQAIGTVTDLQTSLDGKANSTHTHPATDLTATGRTAANFLRGDNTWATPTNTTYTNATQAEIENPASTTGRLITGQRMAQGAIAATASAIGAKQDALVSGTNLKTVNGNSLLGAGDIAISGGGGSGDVAGPASATGDSIAVFDSTTGKLIKQGGTPTISGNRIRNLINPAAATDAATKSYVDSGDSDAVKLTGDQTIAGVKTFSSALVTPSGTSIGGVLHVTGTGFPNGVVSAPVGSKYIDTAATNGAIEWVKATGTGNTGWVILKGDTGWRDVTASMPGTLLVGASKHVHLRRTAESAWFDGRALNPATGTIVISIPAGFDHSSSTAAKGVLIPTDAPGIAGKIQYRMNNSFEWKGAGGAAPGYGLFNYISDDAWPTTLPGTQVTPPLGA